MNQRELLRKYQNRPRCARGIVERLDVFHADFSDARVLRFQIASDAQSIQVECELGLPQNLIGMGNDVQIRGILENRIFYPLTFSNITLGEQYSCLLLYS